jgi:hypothetical protein
MKKSIIAYSKSPAAQTLRAQALKSAASATAPQVTTLSQNTEINLTEGGRKRQRDQRHKKRQSHREMLYLWIQKAHVRQLS